MLELAYDTESVLIGRKNEVRRLEKVFKDCEIRYGRPATNLEVCEDLGINLRELYELLDECSGLEAKNIASCDTDLTELTHIAIKPERTLRSALPQS